MALPWRLQDFGHNFSQQNFSSCSKFNAGADSSKVEQQHFWWFQILQRGRLIEVFEIYFQLYFLNGPIPTSFLFMFALSKHNYRKKSEGLQRDLKLECCSRRRARWPLDHHKGPFSNKVCLCFKAKEYWVEAMLIIITHGKDVLKNERTGTMICS